MRLKTQNLVGILMLTIQFLIMGLSIVFNWGCAPKFDVGLTAIAIIWFVIGIILTAYNKEDEDEYTDDYEYDEDGDY